jgi:hypothetical protein
MPAAAPGSAVTHARTLAGTASCRAPHTHTHLARALHAPCAHAYARAQACDGLARAMKEWERRLGERTGFDDSPGDCMAFKHLRDVSTAGGGGAAARGRVRQARAPPHALAAAEGLACARCSLTRSKPTRQAAQRYVPHTHTRTHTHTHTHTHTRNAAPPTHTHARTHAHAHTHTHTHTHTHCHTHTHTHTATHTHTHTHTHTLPHQAAECRSPEEAADKLQLAFSAAASDAALARLRDWQDGELAARQAAAAGGGAGAAAAGRAVLTVLRLSGDELGFR